MNKKLLISLMAAASLAAHAQAASIAFKASTVRYDYMEYGSSGEYLDSEKANFGKINGFDLGFRFGGWTRDGIKFINDIEISQNKGDTEYVGSLLSNPTPHYGDIVSTTHNKLTEASYKVGVSLPVRDGISLGVQTGLGNRKWDRSLADGNTETYQWSLWSAGGRADFLTYYGEFSMSADYQKAIAPTMSASVPGIDFNLGTTKGYKIDLRWNAPITKELSFEADYVYDYWKIEKSNIVSYGGSGYYEPDSKTKNQILKAGIVYTF